MQDFFNNLYNVVFDWLAAHSLTLLLIVAGALLAQHFSGRVITKLVRRFIKQGGQTKMAEEKRENTLIQVLSGAAYIIIWLIALMMILSEMGIAIGPLIAAAGIAGLAFGFGGQYLIRDLISGMFIILENQYRTGDVVCFDKTCGLVEHLTLRMTTLRDLSGTVHHVPHGEVHTVSNLSKGYSRVNLDIGVAYDSDIEHVIEVVNRVGKEMAEDASWKEHILKAPAFLRVDDFADSAIVIKILGDTTPIMQWDVTGELRKRLKVAFDKEGIVIPFPQRVVHMEK
ncbi:mechanosensitive ion channel family protein [Candidatus Kaiserbacteria bacterium CG10_big_fil_rev_8_21_14_0_10_44_10]|uniref:Mechanosensitive ion channel family protein n=1 Tax=Candidatus Kaiserbacteria bacterium CG10_big_fil_rev_8_21_14_0_10_44_10 TaxID=1974606 RepID=A0A2H0UII3_9BACT|nr:MAG: mechanosensitive ion channel family protein [Candidatus Kaiserbacteria bacterium CG10_big_fil_rev_8_21_14_0_10_44_10]